MAPSQSNHTPEPLDIPPLQFTYEEIVFLHNVVRAFEDYLQVPERFPFDVFIGIETVQHVKQKLSHLVAVKACAAFLMDENEILMVHMALYIFTSLLQFFPPSSEKNAATRYAVSVQSKLLPIVNKVHPWLTTGNHRSLLN